MTSRIPGSRRKTATVSQVLRKRELDRFAQRASRERTRLRIAYLEEKVQRLEAIDRPAQMAELMREVEVLRRENSRLRSLTWKIRCLTDIMATSAEQDQREESTNPAARHLNRNCYGGSNPSAPPVHWPEDWSLSPLPKLQQSQLLLSSPASCSVTDSADNLDFTNIVDLTGNLDFLHASNDIDWSSVQSPLAPARDTHIITTGEHQPAILNKLFAYAVAGVTASAGHPKSLESHVAFRSIMRRAEDVEGDYLNHPLWKALRAVDKQVWGMWPSKAQRVAAMYLCYKLIMYLSCPSKDTLAEVPPFMRPLPCQKEIIHPIATDFHLWPGLREVRICGYTTEYVDPLFPELYLSNLKFDWPLSDDDIFASPGNQESSPLQLSDVFKEYATDINNWWMAEDFFAIYTEFRQYFSPGYKSKM